MSQPVTRVTKPAPPKIDRLPGRIPVTGRLLEPMFNKLLKDYPGDHALSIVTLMMATDRERPVWAFTVRVEDGQGIAGGWYGFSIGCNPKGLFSVRTEYQSRYVESMSGPAVEYAIPPFHWSSTDGIAFAKLIDVAFRGYPARLDAKLP